MHRDDDSMHGLPRAMPVITHQVSCVGRRLVNIRLRRLFLPLQLKDDHRSPYEEDDVGTTGFQGKFVLQNGGMTCCGSIGFKNFTHLNLKLRDRFFPRTNLLRRYFPNKPLQRSSDISWRSIAELRKARIPSMAGKNGDHFIGGQCNSFNLPSGIRPTERGIFPGILSSIHVLVMPF